MNRHWRSGYHYKIAAAPTVPYPATAIPVPDIRQPTSETCGVGALQTVLAHHGVDVMTSTLIPQLQLGTTGMRNRHLVEVARQYGLEAHEITLDVTLLRHLIDARVPVILPIQAWSEKPRDQYADDAVDGHYVVATSQEPGRIFIEDPSTFGRLYVTDAELEDRWHTREGGHAGIVVLGKAHYGDDTAQDLTAAENADHARPTSTPIGK